MAMQVGFSLQADLMTGGSLLHNATGRLLKALSDGGVDFYAVVAAVHLGKQIPVLATQETEVSRLLNTRTGRAGYLAKALSIGWGHSDIAIELARTRAGTSALITIGALATGSTMYTATQAFAELLSMGGCPPEEMPNIDVLKTMISYLAPFVSDLGFRKVFQHISTTSKQSCSRLSERAPPSLEATGEAPEWAKAVRQLVFTAQRRETLHLHVAQRGAWLAAYASHILGMAVRILLEEAVLWESAGTGGSVVIYLAHRAAPSQNITADHKELCIVSPPTTQQGQTPMVLDYLIGEALDAEIKQDTRLTCSVADSIERAIVRLSATLQAQLRMRSRNCEGYTDPNHRVHGNFYDSSNLIHDQCVIFGVTIDNCKAGLATKFSQRIKAWTGSIIQAHGLMYLDQSAAYELQAICGAHGSNLNSPLRIPHCLCCRIGALIHGFAATITALIQCVHDPNMLRIQADVVNGSKLTPWSRATIASREGVIDGFATSAQLFVHLSQLFHGPEALRDSDIVQHWSRSEVLAVSIDSITIYYRALLDRDCFDSKGRALAITSGRISSKGVLRRLAKEANPAIFGDELFYPQGDIAKIADSITTVPHYAKGPLEATMKVAVAEEEFWVQTSLRSNNLGVSEAIGLAKCINNMFLIRIGKPCRHPRDREYLVYSQKGPRYLMTLSGGATNLFASQEDWDEEGSIVFYALKDSTLEQLLQMGISVLENHVLQGGSCLDCATTISMPIFSRALRLIMN